MIEIEEKLVQMLAEMGLTISTAESCTGGMLASRIIDISGASDVYSEGFITYSNEAKMKYLKVEDEILDSYGAVSKETALQMADGCRKETGSDVALVTTGIAGPGGGSAEKPVGLVYIGCAYKDEVISREFRFSGDRYDIRRQAVDEAIAIAVEMLENQ